MRLMVLGLFAIVAAAIAQPLAERFMQSVPELGWRICAFTLTVVGVIALSLSDPIFPRWWGPSSTRLYTTLVPTVIAMSIVGTGTWLAYPIAHRVPRPTSAMLPMSSRFVRQAVEEFV
jgi:hypothetical protein